MQKTENTTLSTRSFSVTVGFGNVDKSMHQIWMEHSNRLLSKKARKKDEKREKNSPKKTQNAIQF